MTFAGNIKRQIIATVQNFIPNSSVQTYDLDISYDQNLVVDI